MKILFIYSLEDIQSVSKPLRSWAEIQFGISYISSVLKAEGYSTRLAVLGSNSSFQNNMKLLNSIIGEFLPDVICFTAVVSQYLFIKKTAGEIKKQWPDKYLVIGGAHATLNPSDVINDSFDTLCVGEGEYPMLELCRQLEANTTPHGIANLWIKSPDGKIEENSPRPFVQEIDNLPFLDRKMWMPWINEQIGAELSLLLGRGCPYGCTYCCNHALKKVAPGKYVRFRSPENIIKELRLLHKEYPAQSRIYFEVESIALNKDWFTGLCQQLEAFNDTVDNFISYGCNFRISPQSMDEKIFSTLKKANFYKINIGLESGSERVRKEILKRDYSNGDFLKTAAMARKAGLKIFIFNIIGLPGETYDDYMETVSLNRECQPDSHYTGIFFPYAGTKLYDMCIREGLVTSDLNYRLERKQPVIDQPHFSKSQVKKAHTWFNYKIYKGYKPLWWLFMQTAMIKIRSDVTFNLLFRTVVQWPVVSNVRTKLAKV